MISNKSVTDTETPLIVTGRSLKDSSSRHMLCAKDTILFGIDLITI